MAGLRGFLSGIALVVLFSIGLIFFMTQMIASNNPTSEITNDPFVNSSLNSFTESADSLQTTGENAKDLLTSYQPSPVYLFLIIYSAFAIPLSFLNFLVLGLNSTLTIVFSVLFGTGSSQFYIVLGVISTLLLIGVVLLVLRAIRTGETER